MRAALKAAALAVLAVAGFLAFCLVIVTIMILGNMVPGS